YSYGEEAESTPEKADSSDTEALEEITILRPGSNGEVNDDELRDDSDSEKEATDVDLLQSVLSGFTDDVEDENSEGTERVPGRRRGLGALARELTDLGE
ncbi:MAG: hypothetical protein OEX97_14415, partial [Acidimicrobiia bacterium]|nr:hypothetical protein [Acidimicrobiia bacterium]